ncbi:MAG: thioesterase family protein [Rudaea sp.]
MNGEPAAALRKLSELAITLRWRDLDAFNHVNNSTFLTYLEEARLRWLGDLVEPWDRGSVSPLLAAVHVNYRRQLGWPGEIIVQLFCERIGNTSLTLAHRIVDAKDESILYLDGNAVMVWIDTASARPVRLPLPIRELCA